MKFLKQTVSLSSSINSPESLKSLRSSLKKKVYAQSGEKLGKIKDLLIEKGVLKGALVSTRDINMFVDKEYFENDSEKALMLNMDPITMLVGKKVFDSDGKYVGKVKNLIRSNNSNNFTSIMVRKRMFMKPIEIHKTLIETSKKNIILNRTIEKNESRQEKDNNI
ncbi:MAG: PRC-barrel domain-containing protein [Candidatus Woesearchaeota archaeon]